MAKRSLILAGGGLKVGFQAGVMQVWLDEAGLTFDHADGASGGCFNLAMYCQGMTGTKIADNWRNLDPFLPVDLNVEGLFRFLNAPSLFTYDRFRQHVLPFWGIDWDKVRAGTRLGTFNLFNFSKKRLEVVTNDGMTRRPPDLRGVAADVVSAGQDRRRHLHRCGLHLRRERRGSDPPRRRRNLGDLDGQHARRMA